MKHLEDLVNISNFYGKRKDYVIAGGGNTSYKSNVFIWIKASGTSLATLKADELAKLDRKILGAILKREYSNDVVQREHEVKQDLEKATITKNKRPSVETSIHNVINYPFVVHTHPTLANGLMCSINAESELKELFGNGVFYIPYTDPGYTLFKKIEKDLKEYEEKYNSHPKVIWLQNHGLFVSGNTIEEIKEIYSDIENIILERTKTSVPDNSQVQIIELGYKNKVEAALKEEAVKFVVFRSSKLIENAFENLNAISKPFIPDQIVYCRSQYIFIKDSNETEALNNIKKQIREYICKNSMFPKVILVKGLGLIAIGESIFEAGIIADVFEDAIKIAVIAKSFGGVHPMTKKQIDFIENWEVENYRRKVASANVN